MRKITHSLIIAAATLSLGICANTTSAVCKCKVHRHTKASCECSGHVPARRPNCSCDSDAYGYDSVEEPVSDPTQQDMEPSQPQEVISEPSVENSIEDNAPVEKAIEATPSEGPSGLQPVEDPASVPNDVKTPINPLPKSDGLGVSPADASQNGSSAQRLRDAINTKRPYAQPTLEKVPNPPIPDTTEVQLRELPIEFDSYGGYLRSGSARTSAIGSSYRASRSGRNSIVTWSATGEPIR